jgi:acyl carrier protein
MREISVADSTAAAIKDQIAGVIRRMLDKQGGERPIGDDDDLGADGGLSSSDMVNLMLAVEDEFGIAIPERDMRPANFRSISSIEALIRRLLPER